jgi:hypothetical protein
VQASRTALASIRLSILRDVAHYRSLALAEVGHDLILDIRENPVAFLVERSGNPLSVNEVLSYIEPLQSLDDGISLAYHLFRAYTEMPTAKVDAEGLIRLSRVFEILPSADAVWLLAVAVHICVSSVAPVHH